MSKPHILIIDDNETLREGAAAIVRKLGHAVTIASSGDAGIEAFQKKPADMVVTDLKMEGKTGLDVMAAIMEKDPDTVIMIMTGFGSVKTAVEAMKNGAFDFIEKPFSPDVLRAKIAAGLNLRNERRRTEKIAGLYQVQSETEAEPFTERDDTGLQKVKGIVGESEAMLTLFKTIEKVARADTTVYVQGESGTGKELVARAIHDLSPRKDSPFVSVNCAAIPATLLESELFGHEKGAFTGAIKRKLGRFELADGGTLFLDEIGDVPVDMQAKLLRALQERVVERVGGEAPVPVDVRVISATHRDIKTMVQEGTFREDLLYRLHIIPLLLPPLRDRHADIPLLARHFIAKHAKRTNPTVKDITPKALGALKTYRWPGNVRELENVIEQALVFCENPSIDADDLPAMLGTLTKSDVEPSKDLPPADDPRTLDEILEGLEKALILRAFERCNKVKTETARTLGLKTSALYYKLAKYKIE